MDEQERKRLRILVKLIRLLLLILKIIIINTIN